MFEWMSERGKDVLEFLLWFYLFSYIPVIPAYFLMSFKGLVGLFSLIYVALSILLIFKLYIKYDNQKDVKRSINPI
jgi:DNA phosphorothioation-dependent restriction protein DptG